MTFWNNVKYFTPEEVGAEDMSPALMFKIDIFRGQIGHSVIVHCGYETSGHSENSYHYKKMALDFHVKGHTDYKEQFRKLMDLKFGGIGWYPEWNNPGWHIDIRSDFLLWKQVNEKYIYFI